MEAGTICSLNNTELFIPKDFITKLGLLAAKIAYHNFEGRYATLVIFNTVHNVALQYFLMNYNKSLAVKFGRFVPQRRYSVSQFVIFGEETLEITNTIRWLIKADYNNNAKFVIVCASHKQECDEHRIFETLGYSFVLNVILLKNIHKKNEVQALSYQIVLPGNCFNLVPDKVDLISNCFKDKCFKKLFPERLSNFHKCGLIISTVEQPPFMYIGNDSNKPSGIDGGVITLATEMLNATLVLKIPSDSTGMGHHLGNNWTGSLGDVYNGRVEASVCAAPLSSINYDHFQISHAYYSMDVVWVAKLPIGKDAWEKLLHPLKIQVRVILLLMFIGIILLNTFKDTKMFYGLTRIFQMRPPKYNLLFYSWTIFLGMPINKIPTRNSLRLMICTWIWFCFIVRCAYQAALINALKHSAYHGTLKSFSDVRKQGIPFGGLPSIREYYQDNPDVFNKWIKVEFDDFDEILLEVLDGTTNFVLASNKEIIKYHIQKYNYTKLLQIIPEKIVNSPTVVYLKKHSPVTAPLSNVLRIGFEAGLVQRFYARYLIRNKKILQQYRVVKPEALNTHNFVACFVLLLLGWIISTIYFIVEYFCGNLTEND